jgi:glycosyltransferase involved in cell wall biosynthesis
VRSILVPESVRNHTQLADIIEILPLMQTPRNPSVLHIVENLDRGAVENWLVRMFRHGKTKGFDLDWTFYCTLGREGALDAEVRAFGGRIVYSSVPIGKKFDFTRALRRELKRRRYDVLHCHHDVVSAIYLAASAGLPIRRRVVHVHNADENLLTPSRWKQKLLREPMRRICLGMADQIVGISQHTLDTFLRGRKRRPCKDKVHYYGIDPSPFRKAKIDRAAFRKSLGLSEDVLLLLFAGRMVPEKNPLFAVEVLSELKRLRPNVAGIFVGRGSAEKAVAARAEQLGLREAFRSLGWRSNVPEIMCSCDWFILPRPESTTEGLGIAVIEAQLAGLRLLLSRSVADDPLLPTACFKRLSLTEGPAAWARVAVKLLDSLPSKDDALRALQDSPFDMDFAFQRLAHLHEFHQS